MRPKQGYGSSPGQEGVVIGNLVWESSRFGLVQVVICQNGEIGSTRRPARRSYITKVDDRAATPQALDILVSYAGAEHFHGIDAARVADWEEKDPRLMAQLEGKVLENHRATWRDVGNCPTGELFARIVVPFD